ncbi:MAG: ABC transporter substrate-binding protein [Chloroflexi bacterium]|nr:ABC transporter substrate-binding protein [Chloroflexota bacterium]
MRTANWLSVAICLTILVSLGCAPVAAPTPAAPQAPVAAATPTAKLAAPAPSPKAESPRYGGVFTLGMGFEIATFDPHAEAAYPALTIIQPVMDGLLDADPLSMAWKVGPGLAERWEASSDALTYTLHLRKDVKFHDGAPFTSADAKASLDRFFFPPRGLVVPFANYFEAVERVEAPDPSTVVIKLKRRFAPLISFLAMGQLLVMPKRIVDKLGATKLNKVPDAIGSGPFKMQEWSPGVGYAVVKNEGYWKKGSPYLDGVRHYLIVDPTSRFAAFRTGRVLALQKAPNILPSEIDTMRKSVPDLTVSTGYSNGAWYFFMNVTQEPFTDKRVRQAMNLAIDRQKVKKVQFGGEGHIGLPILAPYNREMEGIPEEEVVKLPGYRQPKDADIAQARKLLAEAGYPDGFDLTILFRTNAANQTFTTLMVDDLKNIGVKARMQGFDTSAFFDRVAKGLAVASAGPYSAEVPDPHAHMGAHRPTARNYSHWENKRYAELYVLQQEATDQAQRIRLLKEAEALLMEEMPAASTVWESRKIVMWPQVRNWGYGPMAYVGQRFGDVWMAK